jgi:hypothetical protein
MAAAVPVLAYYYPSGLKEVDLEIVRIGSEDQ